MRFDAPRGIIGQYAIYLPSTLDHHQLPVAIARGYRRWWPGFHTATSLSFNKEAPEPIWSATRKSYVDQHHTADLGNFEGWSPPTSYLFAEAKDEDVVPMSLGVEAQARAVNTMITDWSM